MPEMTISILWPDGRPGTCYSPSLVMHDHLQVGERYPLADFVRRSTTGLQQAGERVRAKYGIACSAAIEQTGRLQQQAARFPGGEVQVVAMEPPSPDASGSVS